MPRPKTEFETLYPYQLYEPEEVLDDELMYTVPEIARLLQGLDPATELDAETEDQVVTWTIPWLMAHADELVINDPEGDEPGYFGIQSESRPADEIPDGADE
ncbi:hypothetical protein C499_04661 [Halogeometricum borinquense DSM 11551]|uniref:Uncharacterized protein n=2 Tax=Halogeometricum borinquense TaxID=60847 RepID=E4NT29_HALBP|nr:DUF5827 family protein [Halogeometricum borinquense]ADQ67022.1 hypothetical protein Hbor_14420 [Halogeometricum borinquense DSM 11551]ELY29813.1 hypothetical protein C499_04661 [Halogeometricum borinquense DSM 11551]RYJ13997.1 hypothetical protein ELS19_08485 [Halogeometricum borinquense]